MRIQGIVFAAILTARIAVAGRAMRLDSRWRSLPIVASQPPCSGLRRSETHYAYFIAGGSSGFAVEFVSAVHRRAPTRDILLRGSPAGTGVYGRTDLVFDDWLYPVFESMHLAEPRSSWLPVALSDGSVRFVITASTTRDRRPRPATRSLGYVPRGEFGSLYVWERIPRLAAIRWPESGHRDREHRLRPNWLWRPRCHRVK